MRKKKNKIGIRSDIFNKSLAKRYTNILSMKVSKRDAAKILKATFAEILAETVRIDDSKKGFRFVLPKVGVFYISRQSLRAQGKKKSKLHGVIPYRPLLKFKASRKITNVLTHHLHGFVKEER